MKRLPPSFSLESLKIFLLATTAICAVIALPQAASAQSPTGGSVVAGAAGISQAGAVTNINQSSQKAVINWQGFSVGAQNTVNFNQPNSSAATLNRVIGNEQSVINGAINANGQVFIVNSAGVLFGKGSQVNVGGLVASTLDISNNDFMAGNYKFSGTSSASVVNQGRIRAHGGGQGGGYVALLGKTVSNEGAIAAKLGTVAMASGEKITLNFGGDSLLDVTIDKGTLNALVQNKRAIRADGGQVIMTAKAADQILSAQVNNTGIIQARTMAALKGGGSGSGSSGGKVKIGKIKLLAQGGTTNVSGTLDASAPKGGDGGFIETSGDHVKIADGAVITTKAASGKTGTWLVDPTDFNIVYGNGAQTTSGIGASTLMAMLANTNAMFTTSASDTISNGATENGDINVEAPLTWTSNNSLTLGASNNININAPITWSGTLTLNAGKNIFVNAVMTACTSSICGLSPPSLVAHYGHVVNLVDGSATAALTSGSNANGSAYGLYAYMGGGVGKFDGTIIVDGTNSITLNDVAYTVITDNAGLDAVKTNLSGHYVLGADLNYTVPGSSWSEGIGSSADFTGVFNGFGHRLTINEIGTGLFGTIGAGASVANVGFISTTLKVPDNNGTADAAGVLANVNRGQIVNSFSYLGTVQNADVGPVAAIDTVGGLVGINDSVVINGVVKDGLIAGSYVGSGSVVAGNVAGGLVGKNKGKISESFAGSQILISGNSGTITAVGGLVGINNGTISTSYSAGRIQIAQAAAGAAIGGFVGLNTAQIDQSFVNMADAGNAGDHLAGFVGNNAPTGTITNSYASLYSTDPSALWSAGFAYSNAGTINHAYAITYAGSTAPRSGFVATNTGSVLDSYWYADGVRDANGVANFIVNDNSGATQLTGATQTDAVAAAKTFANYVGFDPAIWAASSFGVPILSYIPLYVNGPATPKAYGAVTTLVSTLTLQANGIQGAFGLVDNIRDNALFGVVSSFGFVDAGYRWAPDVVSSSTSAYKDIRGIIKITPKSLTTGTTITAANKTYDGTAAAPISSGTMTLTGFVTGQSFTISNLTGTFSDKNVGTTKTIILTYNATPGANTKEGNYQILPNSVPKASITPRTLTLSGATVGDKVYDGTTAASMSLVWNGLQGSDIITTTATANFADANAGINKSVNVSGIVLTNASALNYTYTGGTTFATTATITPRVLVLSGAKTPDGTTTVAGANLVATNLVASDSITFVGSATIASASPGLQDITSTAGLQPITGNYVLNGVCNLGACGSVLVSADSRVLSSAPNTVTIVDTGLTATITQTTDRAIIDWFRFSIGSGETVTFNQPSSTAVILNRVVGSQQSIISGALNANGRVFIVNSAGVIFNAGSQVNVGALVASSLAITDIDFNAGNYVFSSTGGSIGPVTAAGTISADNGFVALLGGSNVGNTGHITATNGKVILASVTGANLVLNGAGPALDSYTLTGAAATTTASGTIVVTNGLLETAGRSITTSGLSLDTTGSNGAWSWSQDAVTVGGLALSPDFVSTQLGLRNFSLNALSGDVTINAAITWSANTRLALTASGAININNAVTLNGANATLAMNYGTDYNIRTPASYSGVADAAGPEYDKNGNPVYDGNGHQVIGPVAKRDTSGGVYGSIKFANSANANGLVINGQAYSLIHSMAELATINNVAGNYALATNLVASATPYNYFVVETLPEGSVFAGLGHTIDHLTITGSAGASGQTSGLFGTVISSTLRDLGLTKVNINVSGNGGGSVGALAGAVLVTNAPSIVSGVYSTGRTDSITGTTGITAAGFTAGGLFGSYYGDALTNAFSTVKVTTTSDSLAGGLIGNEGSVILTNTHATGDVVGGASGGLVGSSSGSVLNSYATGTVNGRFGTGGLLGSHASLTFGTTVISNSFATGDVVGLLGTGGLIGRGIYGNGDGMVFSNVYATGNVRANGQIPPASMGEGGLIGYLENNGIPVTVTNAHANGSVTADLNYGGPNSTQNQSGFGGLIGRWNDIYGGGLIENSFATGTVDSSLTAQPQYTGGLVGYATGVNIRGSYSTGAVIGKGVVGGLVGFFSGGALAPGRAPATIDASYSTSTVSTTNGSFAGGLIGQVGSRVNIASSVFYNGDTAGGAGIGNTPGSTVTNQSHGLTGGQVPDAKFYANGTINQVLADRAAAAAQAAAEAAAAAQAASQAAAAQAAVARQALIQQGARTASVVTNNAQTSSETPPDPSMANAGASAAKTAKIEAIDNELKAVDDKVKADDDRRKQERERERRRTAQTGHRGQAGSHAGGGLGATIRSIDVNGQRFNLENGASKPEAPAQQAPQ